MTAQRRTPAPAPSHPDVEILGAEIGFARHLRVEVVRFRHRLFAGGWSGDCGRASGADWEWWSSGCIVYKEVLWTT